MNPDRRDRLGRDPPPHVGGRNWNSRGDFIKGLSEECDRMGTRKSVRSQRTPARYISAIEPRDNVPLPEAARMNCPKCTSAMESMQFDGMDVERCTGCKGLWFDALEEQSLLHAKKSESLDVGEESVGAKWDEMGKIHCPRCGTPMVRMVDRNQPHIWYESCSTCGGLFFDAGEFRDLKDHSPADIVRHRRKGARPLD